MIRIPREIPYNQPNVGDSQGSLWSTFNCDFVTNPGKLRINRTRKVYDSQSDSSFGLPIAFTFFDDNTAPAFWFATSTGDNSGVMYKGGLTPNTSLTQDVRLNTPTNISRLYSDMKVFNLNMYVTQSTSIAKLSSAGSWGAGALASPTLTASKPHLLETYGANLYYTDAGTKVNYLTTADVVTTGIDLKDATTKFISWIKAGTNCIWIGTINQSGETSTIYRWDGVSSQATNSYVINSPGSVACIMLDNIPYVMDSDGRLLAFSGSGFSEVARLPVDRFRLYGALNLNNNRFVHPNGMAIIDGRININVNGSNNDSITSPTINENLPSGVWEYEPGVGLYHKLAISYNPVDSSTVTDWGQMRVNRIGALFSANLMDWASGSGISRNGKILIGANYKLDPTTVTITNGIFIDDTNDTIQKKGYIVTSKLPSSGVLDILKKIFILHKKYLNTNDKISVKYRISEQDPTEYSITWTSTTTFTSTGDWSTYAIGDEVEFTAGVNGGANPHISNMSKVVVGSTTTWTITVDETMASGSGNGKARAQKWIKLGTITGTDTWASLPGVPSYSWIELKIAFTFTGKDELEELVLINDTKQALQ